MEIDGVLAQIMYKENLHLLIFGMVLLIGLLGLIIYLDCSIKLKIKDISFISMIFATIILVGGMGIYSTIDNFSHHVANRRAELNYSYYLDDKEIDETSIDINECNIEYDDYNKVAYIKGSPTHRQAYGIV